MCIRLSNEYGSGPLVIGSATVAMPNDPASVRPGSIQTVTFGGHNSVTIPAGAPVLSDPVAFPVTSGAEISIGLGNRLLNDGFVVSFGVSALARFDRDALALPSVTHIVLLEGLNDIGFPGAKLNGRDLADPADVRTPEDLIDAYRQLISRAHATGSSSLAPRSALLKA